MVNSVMWEIWMEMVDVAQDGKEDVDAEMDVEEVKEEDVDVEEAEEEGLRYRRLSHSSNFRILPFTVLYSPPSLLLSGQKYFMLTFDLCNMA